MPERLAPRALAMPEPTVHFSRSSAPLEWKGLLVEDFYTITQQRLPSSNHHHVI